MSFHIGWISLSDTESTRVRITRTGALIGRDPDCDIVVRDRSASRRHALVRKVGTGFEVISLGRVPTEVNGRPVHSWTSLEDGDVLGLPGVKLAFSIAHAEFSGGGPVTAWAVEVDGGPLIGLARSQVSFGGSDVDDVRIEGLPAAAIVFHRLESMAFAELGVDAKIGDTKVLAGSIENLPHDTEIELNGVRMILRSELPKSGSTVDADGDVPAPSRVQFAFHPVGGRLTLDLPIGTRVVELSELRARLIALLLDPPKGYSAGEHIADEALLSGIWPGESSKGRTDLNTLVHRVRKNLVSAGINPGWVLNRPRLGGSIQFRLAPDADVRIS